MDAPRGSPRVLVMRAGQLGDTVFATSIIEPLFRRYGETVQIDMVVKHGMENLFRYDSRVDRTFTLRHRNLPLPLNLDKFKIVTASWEQPYDLAVNLELGSLLNDLARSLRAKHKVGMPFGRVPDDRDGEHAVNHLRRLFSTFLSEDCLATAEPSLQGPPWRQVADKFHLPDNFIALNPTNSQFTKRDYRSYRAWPLAHWRELIQGLEREHREAIVLLGGKGEQEYFRLLGPLPEGVISLAGQTGLDELITILAQAQALITTDTGPSHVAAAVHTPVLAIFGPSDDRKTGPFATSHNVVYVLNAKLPCSPCSLTDRIKACEWNRCMHEVTPEDVLRTLEGVVR